MNWIKRYFKKQRLNIELSKLKINVSKGLVHYRNENGELSNDYEKIKSLYTIYNLDLLKELNQSLK